MQVAHPSVAQGVADHSDFESDPWSRLVGTLEAVYTIVFGTDEQAERMAAVVHAVHERVDRRGLPAPTTPPCCAGSTPRSSTPGCACTRPLVGPLSPADQEAYYRQATEVAELLGCPRSAQPPDLASFRDYVRTMVGSLEVTDTARRLADSIWRPDLPVPGPLVGPPFSLAKFLTVGMLPAPLRLQYGLRWDRRRKAGARCGRWPPPRLAYPLLPRPLREAPKSYFLAAPPDAGLLDVRDGRRRRRRPAAAGVVDGDDGARRAVDVPRCTREQRALDRGEAPGGVVVSAVPRTRYRTGDAELDQQLARLLDEVGAEHDRDLLFEILVSGVRLAGDGADRLDLKITNAALKEMRAAFRAFAPYRDRPQGDDLRLGPHEDRPPGLRAGARRSPPGSPRTTGWSSPAPGPGSWPPASRAPGATTASA